MFYTIKQYEDGCVEYHKYGMNNLLLTLSYPPEEIFKRFGLRTNHAVLDIGPLVAMSPFNMHNRDSDVGHTLMKVFDIKSESIENKSYHTHLDILILEAMIINLTLFNKTNEVTRNSIVSLLDYCRSHNDEYKDWLTHDTLSSLTHEEIRVVMEYFDRFHNTLVRIMDSWSKHPRTNILWVDDSSFDVARCLHNPSLITNFYHLSNVELSGNIDGVNYGRMYIRFWSDYNENYSTDI